MNELIEIYKTRNFIPANNQENICDEFPLLRKLNTALQQLY